MEDKHFIMTQDNTTAEILLNHGYKLFSMSGDTYIFENSPANTFSEMSDLKIVYTNTFFA